jgi:hypothetical protein
MKPGDGHKNAFDSLRKKKQGLEIFLIGRITCEKQKVYQS